MPFAIMQAALNIYKRKEQNTMAKMYTLDEKMLIGTPEIRIGDKIYPVDNRVKTVKKVIKLYENGEENVDTADKILEYAFSPKDCKEIMEMNMPWNAYQQLITLVVSAMTGEDIDEKVTKKDDRFQPGK